MSLDALAKTRLSELAKTRELKTLMVDIERLPGSFTADFWDMNAFKNRRIHPDQVTEWPRTICVAWQWYGAKAVDFAAVWETGTPDESPSDIMHRRIWDAYDAADLVITYNGVGFDNRHLVSGWTERGMGKPSSWRDIDLLKVARQSQGWESKTLDAVCKRLGIPAKNDHYTVEVARDAVAGDKAAQRKLRGYNVNDTKIMGAVYERLMPFIKSHPHVSPSTYDPDKPSCGRCNSTDVARVGTYSPGVYNYPEWRCNTCGGSWRSTYESRGPSVRAL